MISLPKLGTLKHFSSAPENPRNIMVRIGAELQTKGQDGDAKNN